jgi:MFS family permease
LKNHRISDVRSSKKPRFFYGYVIVSVSFVIMTMTFGINYSFGVFFQPLIAEFGWTRGVTSGAYSVMTFIAGFLGIFAGRLNDTFGSKIIGITAGLSLGIGFLLLSRINAIWHFYLIHSLILPVGIGSCWPGLVPSIARWFTAKRGLMTGIVASGIGFGILAIPPLADWIISHYDWRKAYMIIGILTLVLPLLLAQFLKRDPAQIGQFPYGEEGLTRIDKSQEIRGLYFKQAIYTGHFALLCGIYFCYGYCLHTVMIHIVPHAVDMGILTASAAGILAIIGGTSIPSRILIAGASDKIGVKPSLIMALSMLVVSLFWIHSARKLWMLYLFGALFGTAYGGVISLQALAVAELFGLRSVGVILGTITFAYTIGAAVGPVISGYIFDIMKSYNPVFWVAAALAVVALFLSLFVKMPGKAKGRPESPPLELIQDMS